VTSAKYIGLILLVVIGWIVMTLTLSHWWSVSTASDHAMGHSEVLAREVLRNVPNVVYFFCVGLLWSAKAGARTGGAWAALCAAIAMLLPAALSQHTFYDNIGPVEAAILGINYGTPILFAVGGALVIYAWRAFGNGVAET
jgi:hypothetical protein